MQILKVNLVLVIVLFFSLSCQSPKENTSVSSDDEQTKMVEATEVENTKTGTEIAMDSTKSYCYVKNVFEENGKMLITVDFIEVKWAEENEDGVEEYSEIVQSSTPKTFILNSSTKYTPEGMLDLAGVKEALKTQTEQNATNNAEDAYYQRFNIEVKDGVVITLFIDMAG